VELFSYMTQQNQSSDSLLFPVSPLQKAIADIIPTIAGGSKWSAFNAIRYLNKAYKLSAIDKEIAIFCAITAEEESATAVFKSLQSKHYENAGKLKPRDHIFKNALASYLVGLWNNLVELEISISHITGVITKERRLAIEIELLVVDEFGQQYNQIVRPIPPLDFKLTKRFGKGIKHKIDFRSYFSDVIAVQNKTLEGYLNEMANQRNYILYASDKGYHGVKEDFEQLFESFKNRTFINLAAYLLIVQYKKQSFVQDALNSFLQVVGAIPPHVEIKHFDN
jgi:hypothetical protein